MRESASIAKLLDSLHPPTIAECRILNLLDLPIINIASSSQSVSINPSFFTIWHPPEQPFHKLNYDGASKNNLGLIGFGGVFRNSMGSILWIYYGNLGHTTNNVTELQALARGLVIAKKNNF